MVVRIQDSYFGLPFIRWFHGLCCWGYYQEWVLACECLSLVDAVFEAHSSKSCMNTCHVKLFCSTQPVRIWLLSLIWLRIRGDWCVRNVRRQVSAAFLDIGVCIRSRKACLDDCHVSGHNASVTSATLLVSKIEWNENSEYSKQKAVYWVAESDQKMRIRVMQQRFSVLLYRVWKNIIRWLYSRINE